MDELNILLAARLDEKKSVKNIASQIDIIQKQLEDIKIGLNLNDLKTEFNKLMTEFAKESSNAKMYDSNKTNAEIDKTRNSLKKLKDELSGYDKTKVSLSYVDNGSGEKLKKVVTDYKNELNETISIVELINTKTGETLSVQKFLTDNIEKRNKANEKELELQKKLKEQINARLNSLPKKDIGTFKTNEMYALFNISETSDDLKEVKSLVDAYYKECIANEKLLKAQKENTSKDMIAALKEEASKAEYVRKKRNELLDIERQIAKAQIEKGIDTSSIDISKIRTELEDLEKVGLGFNPADKKYIDDIVVKLKQQLKTEKDIADINDKKEKAYDKIAKQINRINDIISKNSKYDENTYKNLIEGLEVLSKELKNGEISFAEFEQRLSKTENAVDSFNTSSKKLSSTTNSLSESLKKFATFYSLYDVLELGKRAISSMVDGIFNLDSAITELNKVAQIDDMESYVNDMYKLGDQLAKTGSDMTQISAGFARAGFRDSDLITLSEVAGMMMNVGDSAMGLEDTVGGLTSALLGFKIPAEQAMDLLHSMNNIANNSNNTMSDLVMALQRTSGTMGAFGVEYQQALGMFGAANEILMSPEMVTRGLNSLSMRIRGLTESGEAIEGLTPKLKGLYDSIGVAITDSEGEMLDIYTIMDNLNKVWDTLSPNVQQNISQMSAGVEQSKMFITLQENWSRANEITTLGIEHQNSAFAENERVIQSLEGHVNKLKSTWEQLSNNTLNSETVKVILDIADGFLKCVDNIGVFNIALVGTTGALAAFSSVKNIVWLTELPALFAKITVGVKTLTSALLTNPLFIGAVGLVATIKLVDALTISIEEQREKVNKLSEEVKTLQSEYAQLLNKENLTSDEQERLVFLEIELELQKDLLEVENQRLANKTLFGEGVWGDGESKAIQQRIDDYNMLSSNIENVRNDIERMESQNQDGKYNSEIQYQREHLEKLKLQHKELGVQIATDNENIASKMELVSDKYKEQARELFDLTEAIKNEILTTYEAKGANDELANSIDKLSDEYNTSVEKIELLNRVINSLNDNQTLTSDTILSLLEKFPSLRGEITETNGAYSISKDTLLELKNQMESTFVDTAKAIENASKQFDDASDKIAALNAISKELKESNGLSADSFKKIASEFPELLGYMNDEASLADAIKDKMESLSAVQGDAYRQMLFNSEEYYEQNVLGNEQMITSISSGIEDLFRNLSTAYQGDLNNWKTLAQGKADIETQLITSLNKEWEKHFGTLMTQFNKMPNTPIATPQFDEDKARNEIKAKNPHLTPGRVEALLNMARNDFKQQTDEYKEFQKEVVKRNQELANMFSDVKFDAVDIKVGGGGKIGSGSKSKGASSSKDSFEKYYSQLIDETIDTILSENERLEDAIAFAQEKLANAELKGDTKQQKVLNKQILEFTKQKKELSHKMAEELRKVGNDVRIQLGNMNIKGYENFNFANLTTLDVSKIVQSYDKAMVGASDAVKANIEKEKSMFEELANVVIRIYGEEIPNLQKQWWSEDTNYRQQQIDKIHEIADLEKRAYDDKVKRIQLEQMLMDDSSKEYQAKEEEKYQLLLGLKLRYEDKIRQLKAQGLSQESEDVRKYVDLWVDAEEELLNMRKSMAERQREIGLKGYEERLKVLNDQKAAIKTISDLTIQMVKKEIEIKKKAFQEEIDGYQAVINKKKESLRKEKEDNDYKKELSEIEKQEEILNNKIAELSLDNSGNMNEKRLELEEELRELLEKKEELQNDKSLQNKEDLLDQELEAFEKEKQEEIDKLDEYLDKEGQLRQDALDMIKNNNKEMYEKLLEYNATYGDAMQEDIVKAWGLATDAANEFNNGQMDLLDILKDVTDEMAEQVRLQDELKNAHWADIPLGNNTENSPSGSGSTGGSSWHDKKDKIAKQMQSNSKEWFNASDEQKKKLAQENEKLGQQIGAWKGSDGEWWIMINGKRMKLYDSIGVRHTGIETGFVGGKALSKGSQEFMKLMRGEEFNILKAGEIVANPRQMDNVMNKVIPGMLARNSKTPELKIEGDLCSIVINGNADKDTVKLLRK